MATIKAYTDISQSKKLAEILPIESADMLWVYYYNGKDYCVPNIRPFRDMHNNIPKGYTPAWSLAALLEQFPYELCDDDGNSSYFQINKEDDVYQLVYEDPYGDFENIETDRYEHFVDACYQMIMKLNEQNLL